MFDVVGIVGVGLIGSSLALEIKNNKLAKSIIGFDNDKKSLDIALNRGIIDVYGSFDELSVCDFVVVATPVASICNILKTVFGKLKENSIVIDVGSVKGAIIDCIKNDIKDNIHYIPIHPIAGIEKFGVNAAKKGLFNNAYCIITPFEGINRFAMSRVEHFLKKLGMKVEIMNPDEHDRVFAYISHLPHVIAYGLVGLIEDKNNEKFKFIGGGFKDFTRIAASSEKMWSDIFMLNKDSLMASIDDFIVHINKMKSMIETDNIGELTEYLKKARLFKESLDER